MATTTSGRSPRMVPAPRWRNDCPARIRQDAGNWTASPAPGGTPAAVNFPPPGVPIRHVFVDADSTWRFNDSDTRTVRRTGPALLSTIPSWPTGQPIFGTSSASPVLTVTHYLADRYRAGAITGVANGATSAQRPIPPPLTGFPKCDRRRKSRPIGQVSRPRVRTGGSLRWQR